VIETEHLSRAVAPHQPPARGEHERNPGAGASPVQGVASAVPHAAARSSPGAPPGHALGGDPEYLAKAPGPMSMASYAVMSGEENGHGDARPPLEGPGRGGVPTSSPPGL